MSVRVVRHGIIDFMGRPSGDFLTVDGIALGEFRDLVSAEHANRGPGNMRRMWFTGSPYADEIWKLVRQARPDWTAFPEARP